MTYSGKSTVSHKRLILMSRGDESTSQWEEPTYLQLVRSCLARVIKSSRACTPGSYSTQSSCRPEHLRKRGKNYATPYRFTIFCW